MKALIGQTVNLPCVVQGEPSPEITWFHNGLPVGAKNTVPFRIQKASLDDQGTYQCVARNSAGQETSEIKLEILGKYLKFSFLRAVSQTAVYTIYRESCFNKENLVKKLFFFHLQYEHLFVLTESLTFCQLQLPRITCLKGLLRRGN